MDALEQIVKQLPEGAVVLEAKGAFLHGITRDGQLSVDVHGIGRRNYTPAKDQPLIKGSFIALVEYSCSGEISTRAVEVDVPYRV